jgi:hypothetical protein
MVKKRERTFGFETILTNAPEPKEDTLEVTEKKPVGKKEELKKEKEKEDTGDVTLDLKKYRRGKKLFTIVRVETEIWDGFKKLAVKHDIPHAGNILNDVLREFIEKQKQK